MKRIKKHIKRRHYVKHTSDLWTWLNLVFLFRLNMYIKTNGLPLQYIYMCVYFSQYVKSEENSYYWSIMCVGFPYRFSCKRHSFRVSVRCKFVSHERFQVPSEWCRWGWKDNYRHTPPGSISPIHRSRKRRYSRMRKPGIAKSQNFNSLPPRGPEQRVLLTRTNHLGSSRFKVTQYLRFHLPNLTRKD